MALFFAHPVVHGRSAIPMNNILVTADSRTKRNMSINSNIFLHPPLNRETPSAEQTARQTKSRAVSWTPSKSRLLRTAADKHAASVEQPDVIRVILRRSIKTRPHSAAISESVKVLSRRSDECNMQSPSGVQGQSPWSGGQGASPP